MSYSKFWMLLRYRFSCYDVERVLIVFFYWIYVCVYQHATYFQHFNTNISKEKIFENSTSRDQLLWQITMLEKYSCAVHHYCTRTEP